jgi:hypothetical protein
MSWQQKTVLSLLAAQGFCVDLDEELIKKEAEASRNLCWRNPTCE